VDILVAGLIIAAACTVTCGLLYAFHRFGKRDALLADTTRGAGVYGVVGTSFAVLLAFVVLIAFQSYTDAKEGAAHEAEAALELFRTAEFFPERTDVQGELVCYGRSAIHTDWPAMRERERSPVTDRWALRLQNSYEGLRVETLKEQAAFSQMLSLRDDRVDSRRQRLTQATPIITSPVWFILGLGALLNIAFVLLFVDRRSEALFVQFILMASVTAIVIAGLLLIWFLDHPYYDRNGSIKPIEMEETISIMEQQRPELVPPCDRTGEPLSGTVSTNGFRRPSGPWG
jgi:hypothetical protein